MCQVCPNKVAKILPWPYGCRWHKRSCFCGPTCSPPPLQPATWESLSRMPLCVVDIHASRCWIRKAARLTRNSETKPRGPSHAAPKSLGSLGHLCQPLLLSKRTSCSQRVSSSGQFNPYLNLESSGSSDWQMMLSLCGLGGSPLFHALLLPGKYVSFFPGLTWLGRDFRFITTDLFLSQHLPKVSEIPGLHLSVRHKSSGCAPSQKYT